MAEGGKAQNIYNVNPSGDHAMAFGSFSNSGANSHFGTVINNNATVDEEAAKSGESSLSLWHQVVIKEDMKGFDWEEDVKLDPGVYPEKDTVGPHYKMNSIPRGHALIINNVNFKGPRKLKTRDGADSDVLNFKSIFKTELQFKHLRYERNLTLQVMKDELVYLQSYNYSEVDSMVLIISSHGGKEGVYSKDEKVLKYQEIIDMFSDEKCPKLRGKPKLIFFLCCRGREVTKYDGVGEDDYKVPKDTLVAFATTDDHVSYREDTGTVYGQNLVSALSQYAKSKDLVSILEDAKEKTMKVRCRSKLADYDCRQEPVYINKLEKKLLLDCQ